MAEDKAKSEGTGSGGEQTRNVVAAVFAAEGTGSNSERTRDVVAAFCAAVYLLAALAFFAWQLFDVWGEKYYFLQHIVLRDIMRLSKDDLIAPGKLESGVFRAMAFAVIGGGMGGAVNGVRSILERHADIAKKSKKFNWRFAYVYVFLPPLGATLGLIAVALTRTGLGVLSGEVEVPTGTAPAVSSLAIGFLAGYGSGDVFLWLDSRVSALFRPSSISVPSLLGKTRVDAEAALVAVKLNLGKVTHDPTAAGPAGLVIEQTPRAFSYRSEGSQVDVTVSGAAPA